MSEEIGIFKFNSDLFSLNIYLGKLSGKKSESFLGCKIELTNLIFKDQIARNCLEDAFLMVFSL